jgi:cytochrome c oxidase subunit 2
MTSWFPPEASHQAAATDQAFAGIWFGTVLALVLLVGLAVTFVLLFRRQDPSQVGAAAGPVDRRLQVGWVVGALVLGISAFAADLGGFFDQMVPPPGATEVDVVARRGAWAFQHPGGHVADTLHVAVDEPVVLNLRSEDVPHALNVPALRLNQGVLPDRTTHAWFVADRIDTFELRSNDHRLPPTALVTHSREAYAQWLDSVTNVLSTMDPVAAGAHFYVTFGCKTCHSIDGTRLTGPSLRDVFGGSFASTTGAVNLVDEAFVRQSILEPNASVRAGFEPVMTAFAGRIDDAEIDAIIAWLKSISTHAEVVAGEEVAR